jgi:hypothetical protein
MRLRIQSWGAGRSGRVHPLALSMFEAKHAGPWKRGSSDDFRTVNPGIARSACGSIQHGRSIGKAVLSAALRKVVRSPIAQLPTEIEVMSVRCHAKCRTLCDSRKH